MDSAGINPETATDTEISNYASFYFEYDSEQRVTKEILKAGSQTYTFAYTSRVPIGTDDGYNKWQTKTVETRPDGSKNIAYSNYSGEVMLKALENGSNSWIDYTEFHPISGRATLMASPAAVGSYNDASADLAVVLNATGLITIQEWYSSTNGAGEASGYLKSTSIKNGASGTAVKQKLLKYANHTEAGNTISKISSETIYRTEAGGGTDPITTTHAYTYHPGTLQVKKQTTTLPVISTAQNGDGNTYTTESVYDLFGRLCWSKNELGYINHTTYVPTTGAMLQSIQDVDTSITAGAPAGWVTVAGAGKNLISDYQSDNQGRTTQMLGPEHSIDINGTATNIRTATYTVYRDDIRQTWSAQGYADGTIPGYGYHTINPISIIKMDANGRTTDTIQAQLGDEPTSADDCKGVQAIPGRLSAADTFPQSSYLRWSKTHYDQYGRTDWQRSYFDIPETGAGLHGKNYLQTELGYDNMDRQNRSKSGEGTIQRTIYDVRSQVTETWIGTNDTGATQNDPTGAGATDNNMVKVSTSIYDNNNAGGNGLLTSSVQHVTGSDDRTTSYIYDWRDRQIGIDGEESTYSLTAYDNLNQTILSEQRAGTSTSTLLGKSETFFDDLGRAYQSKTWGVDSSGNTTNALTSNTWLDGAGRTLKQSTPGTKASTKIAYDSLNRTTATYLTYPENGTEVNTNDISADIVIE